MKKTLSKSRKEEKGTKSTKNNVYCLIAKIWCKKYHQHLKDEMNAQSTLAKKHTHSLSEED